MVCLHVGQEGDPRGREDQGHDPEANKLLTKHYPGQQVDERGVGGEEGGDHGAVQHLKCLDVEVVGKDGEQAEHHAAQH